MIKERNIPMKINLQAVKTVLMNPKISGNSIEKNTILSRASVSLYRKGFEVLYLYQSILE